jgi:hypothetical protein
VLARSRLRSALGEPCGWWRPGFILLHLLPPFPQTAARFGQLATTSCPTFATDTQISATMMNAESTVELAVLQVAASPVLLRASPREGYLDCPLRGLSPNKITSDQNRAFRSRFRYPRDVCLPVRCVGTPGLVTLGIP